LSSELEDVQYGVAWNPEPDRVRHHAGFLGSPVIPTVLTAAIVFFHSSRA
jgi:hypothetical protein